jgi:hypothetical protein
MKNKKHRHLLRVGRRGEEYETKPKQISTNNQVQLLIKTNSKKKEYSTAKTTRKMMLSAQLAEQGSANPMCA